MDRFNIKSSRKCCCLRCYKLFDKTEIKNWTIDGKAYCPFCNTDAVIGTASSDAAQILISLLEKI